jgi:tagaturonate reductase
MDVSTLPALSAVAPARAAGPERVLQFGTGAFLRGFADALLDEAIGDDRVVMVGSTGSGRAATLEAQDGQYTLVVRGLRDGEPVDEACLVGSVSRALAASDDWDAVLDLARSPDLRFVVSNTTEVGITDDPDDRPDLDPPRSFPGKLAAALAARAAAHDYEGAGLVVLPCELIEGNGDRLREIVEAHAERWGLDTRFLPWLDREVTFGNTLVDRIVPGTPDDPDDLYERIGYTDDLLTVAEPYRLWAIEGVDPARLGALADVAGVVVTDDLTPYRERKVRVLNGGHTATVPAALLCGLDTVAEAMDDETVGAFVRRVILDEIVPSLDVDRAMAEAFARDVIDRFANPFVAHALRDITFQQTAKLGVRVAPSVAGYREKRGEVPPLLCVGVAALLAAVRPGAVEGLSADDASDDWRLRWDGVDRSDADALRAFAADALGRWGLDAVDGVPEAVGDALIAIERNGCRAALAARL